MAPPTQFPDVTPLHLDIQNRMSPPGLRLVPLQQLQDPPPVKLGQSEDQARGLHQVQANPVCLDALHADQQHLHIYPGKLAVCKNSKELAQYQLRESVIVTNPQVRSETQHFSPVKSEKNDWELEASTSPVNFVHDNTVFLVEQGGDFWYTPQL